MKRYFIKGPYDFGPAKDGKYPTEEERGDFWILVVVVIFMIIVLCL